jgi:hypothetical protein
LYGLALIHADLPPRAQFLHLVQALEALHSYEHRIEDEAAQTAFTAERASALEALNEAGLSQATLTFVRKNWSTRKQESLSRRLNDLIERIPASVRKSLTTPDMTAIADLLGVTEKPTLANQYQRLRNDLSHGDRNFDVRALLPWVRSIETLCRGHALRLLGFDDSAIESALVS